MLGWLCRCDQHYISALRLWQLVSEELFLAPTQGLRSHTILRFQPEELRLADFTGHVRVASLLRIVMMDARVVALWIPHRLGL